MPNFDKLFEEVISKAKTVADSTGKLAGEMAEVGKLKYKSKQISWEIERTYAKLGVIVYEARKTGGDFETVIGAAVHEIDELNAKLDLLEEKIRDVKKGDRYRPSKSDLGQDEEAVEVDFEEVADEEE